MEKIIIKSLVYYKLYELVDLLYEKEYKSYIADAEKYVNHIFEDIENNRQT